MLVTIGGTYDWKSDDDDDDDCFVIHESFLIDKGDWNMIMLRCEESLLNQRLLSDDREQYFCDCLCQSARWWMSPVYIFGIKVQPNNKPNNNLLTANERIM